MNRRSLTVLAALALALTSTRAVAGFIEDFDQAGSDPAASFFSDVIGGIIGSYSRIPIGAGDAPDTTPPLPVNVGGDKELEFAGGATSAVSDYLVSADAPAGLFSDVRMDGYLGFKTPSSFGEPTAGFVTRFSGTSVGDVDAYVAIMNVDALGTEAFLRIARIDSGIISGPSLAISDTFTVDTASENYRLIFEVVGSSLTAELFRVEESAGSIAESAIDLDFGTGGIQNTLTATDSALTSGRIGFRTFAGSSNRIYFDDIAVDEVPEPTSMALVMAPMLLWAFGRTRATRGPASAPVQPAR